ncbi:MAG: hypothetical protein AB7S26_20580 [Sandaracinaceae bacterium]
MSQGIDAYREAARGDFTRIGPAIEALASSRSALDRGYALALRELAAATAPALAAPVRIDELRADAEGARDAIGMALHHRAVARTIAFDVEGLTETDALARELAGSSVACRATAELSAMAIAVLGGTAPPTIDEAAVRDAARACDPAFAVHAEAWLALAALDMGAADDALARARRASRMAATEGLLQAEYFANLALARVRRRLGRGHLAVRILTSLAAVVPSPWMRWVGLERALAGAVRETPLADALARAERGDRVGFVSSALEVARGVAGFAPLAAELEVFVELIDPTRPPSARSSSWVHGETDVPPLGLRDPARSAMAVACVAFGGGMSARRIFTAGAAMLGSDAVRIAPTASAIRTHHAIARLGLAGDEGVAVRELFEAVYGFALLDPTHEEVFRGLLHRVRKELGDAATVERDGERVRVEPRVTIVVPDPRCEVALGDRILTFLAGSGGRASARSIADALHIPLRTTQRALSELVEDGACAAEPDGRRVEYIVEDTTFHEPTLHRLRGRTPG